MEREGKVKHISLYREQKLCKLGYAGLGLSKCFDVCNQKDLFQILPRLYLDLSESKMDT